MCDFSWLVFYFISLEGMKMRGSKPDSNGSQKLLSKEVGSLSSISISLLLSFYCTYTSLINLYFLTLLLPGWRPKMGRGEHPYNCRWCVSKINLNLRACLHLELTCILVTWTQVDSRDTLPLTPVSIMCLHWPLVCSLLPMSLMIEGQRALCTVITSTLLVAAQ